MRSLLPTGLAMALAAGGAFALADGGVAGPRSRLVADDAAPLFRAANLRPGDRRAACASFRNDGDAPARVALYAAGRRGELAKHLRLVVRRSCDSGGPVLFRGTLAGLSTSVDGAIYDGNEWRSGERHSYRFELSLDDDEAAEGKSVSWDWRLAAETVPLAPPPSHGSVRSAGLPTCRITLATPSVVLRSRGVRLRVRVLRARRLELLASASGVRAVRYRLNTTRAVRIRKRPFRVRVSTSGLVVGRNRLRVTTTPRRGRARTVTFRLKGRTTCG